MANRYTLTEQQKTVDTYLKGCVNLYGFVTPGQFLKVYNCYNASKIKKDDLLRWADKLERQSYDSYTIYTNAIINNSVPKGKIDQIVCFQEGKDYYMPTEKEILSYANSDFYEKTKFTEELYQFLTCEMKTPVFIANGFISKLMWLIKTEEPILQQSKLMESCGIIPDNLVVANQLLSKIQNLNNNTRKWANCGFTPKELFEESKKNKKQHKSPPITDNHY